MGTKPGAVTTVDLSAGTFLGSLEARARASLLEGTTETTVGAGLLLYAASDPQPHMAIVLEGLVRAFLATTDGRRLTVRYARRGALIGAYGTTVRRAPLSVEAVTDCTVVELDADRVQRLLEADGVSGWRMVVELGVRLQDAYATVAANMFGSLEQRVAGHLLELAVPTRDGVLVAHVTQQVLAESVGAARQSVARVLRALREEKTVATGSAEIELCDPDRLAAIVGRLQVAHEP